MPVQRGSGYESGRPGLRSEPSNALRLRCLSHTSKHRVTPWREAGDDAFESTVLKNPIILATPTIAMHCSAIRSNTNPRHRFNHHLKTIVSMSKDEIA